MLSNSIAMRAALGFALVSAVTGAAVVSSTLLAQRQADAREQIVERYAADLANTERVEMEVERMIAASRGYLLTEEPGLLVRVKDAEAALDGALQSLDEGRRRPSEEELLREVRRLATHYRSALDELLLSTTASEDRQSLAKALRERLSPAREELGQSIQNLLAHERRLQLDTRRETTRMAARADRLAIGLGAAAIVMSALLAWLFTRRLAEIHRREQESARRASRALAAKEDILGVVAHDLRSPLAAIVLRASAIAKHSGDEKVRGSAAAIRTTCDRMGALIQSLLDAASIEAGKMSVSVGRCRVTEVFSDILETFGPEATAKSIRLEQEVAPRGLEVLGDRERLFQVLSNLVGNALKFTPEGGAVAVSALATDGRVRFQVRDTGSGILRV
jgi:signal transduction histidine kinase